MDQKESGARRIRDKLFFFGHGKIKGVKICSKRDRQKRGRVSFFGVKSDFRSECIQKNQPEAWIIVLFEISLEMHGWQHIWRYVSPGLILLYPSAHAAPRRGMSELLRHPKCLSVVQGILCLNYFFAEQCSTFF